MRKDQIDDIRLELDHLMRHVGCEKNLLTPWLVTKIECIEEILNHNKAKSDCDLDSFLTLARKYYDDLGFSRTERIFHLEAIAADLSKLLK